MEQQEKQEKTIRKLTKQLKMYMKKVEDFEGNQIKKRIKKMYGCRLYIKKISICTIYLFFFF